MWLVPPHAIKSAAGQRGQRAHARVGGPVVWLSVCCLCHIVYLFSLCGLLLQDVSDKLSIRTTTKVHAIFCAFERKNDHCIFSATTFLHGRRVWAAVFRVRGIKTLDIWSIRRAQKGPIIHQQECTLPGTFLLMNYWQECTEWCKNILLPSEVGIGMA